MGIQQRKEREKEDLRRSILDAAREVFLEKGYKATSIRNIAEKIEYSPTTIYLYYKDKDAIFHALHSEGFCMMNEKMDVLRFIADPFERLVAMGRIYLDFAMKNQELYDLMFIEKAPIDCIESNHETWQEGQNTFGGLVLTVKECIEKGYFPQQDAEVAAFVIWSTVHGMCSLQISNRCTKVISEQHQADIIEKGFESFLLLLGAMRTRA
jgi:AcrR family transcriptional regulator